VSVGRPPVGVEGGLIDLVGASLSLITKSTLTEAERNIRTRKRKEPIKLKRLPTSSRGLASLAWHASILPSCMSRVAAEVSNERALPAPRLRLAVAQLVRSVIMTASIQPDSLTSP
jgi:hypothetical protein